MRQLGMVGTSFRRGGQAELERFAFPPEESEQRIRALHQACGFSESVYLSTCNRVEVIFVGDRATPVSEYRRRVFRFFNDTPNDASDDVRQAAKALHAYGGEGAAEHLFCVASAIDSMNPGEAQILGQVKEAYRTAQELKLAGRRLRMIFEEAFETAKRVRATTTLGAHTISMLSLALGLLEEILAQGRGVLAVIGAGDMSRQCGEHLGGRDDVELVFVNRTVGKARALAKEFGGRSLGLKEFLEEPGEVGAIVTSTAAKEPFLDGPFFARLGEQRPIVVDLAVPRDTDPLAAKDHGADLFDIDRLKQLAEENRKKREAEIAQARTILDQSLDALRRRVIDRDIGPVVRVLRKRFEHTAEVGIERLFAKRLKHLPADDREQVRQWARALVNRFSHLPTVGLKRVAFEHGFEAVEAFVEGVGGDFSAAVKEEEEEACPQRIKANKANEAKQEKEE